MWHTMYNFSWSYIICSKVNNSNRIFYQPLFFLLYYISVTNIYIYIFLLIQINNIENKYHILHIFQLLNPILFVLRCIKWLESENWEVNFLFFFGFFTAYLFVCFYMTWDVQFFLGYPSSFPESIVHANRIFNQPYQILVENCVVCSLWFFGFRVMLHVYLL